MTIDDELKAAIEIFAIGPNTANIAYPDACLTLQENLTQAVLLLNSKEYGSCCLTTDELKDVICNGQDAYTELQGWDLSR